ncbi:hypothetical protein AGLY_008109 [Aphis glycines]|uniref:Uncharacterized protein n=1 Tax=Aphis glycines TaxID=307491 RepID=A0A6G0TLG4_APHGL|nr:hypothetical protein AGLY_008109 [Aphis glycines]
MSLNQYKNMHKEKNNLIIYCICPNPFRYDNSKPHVLLDRKEGWVRGKRFHVDLGIGGINIVLGAGRYTDLRGSNTSDASHRMKTKREWDYVTMCSIKFVLKPLYTKLYDYNMLFFKVMDDTKYIQSWEYNNFGVVEHVLRELRTLASGEWNNLNNLFKITLLHIIIIIYHILVLYSYYNAIKLQVLHPQRGERRNNRMRVVHTLHRLQLLARCELSFLIKQIHFCRHSSAKSLRNIPKV